MNFKIFTILTLVTIAISCNTTPNSIKKLEGIQSTNQMDSVKMPEEICTSNSIDFLKLSDSEIQSTLFNKIDSVTVQQYPKEEEREKLLFELTPEILKIFITEINVDSLKNKMYFAKEYDFNIAPTAYTDSKICKDKLEVIFNKELCSFRLVVYNTFLVESNWCTESTVSYGFGIKNNTIVNLWRQEAG